MFKFNSNHIMTGQIKQILNAFNLPSYKVYTAQHYKFFLDNGYESPELSDGLYIKHDLIMEYKNGKWSRDLDTYGYNNKYLNFTRSFPIVNNIYDSDTHEYLGDFLRFQRDYLGIDLMPLYNCFSNRICNNLNISIESQLPSYEIPTGKMITKTIPAVYDNKELGDRIPNNIIAPAVTIEVPEMQTEQGETYTIKRAFYTKDTNYMIYMLPIKFFKSYTLAMDCATNVEICCGFYNHYLDKIEEDQILVGGQLNLPPVDMSQYISDYTYRKFVGLRFNNPVLWQGITLDTFNKILDKCIANRPDTGTTLTREQAIAGYKQRLLEKESFLKLFIKIPVNNKTSITVLEGDYRDYNNYKYGPETRDIAFTYQTELKDENGMLILDENGNPQVGPAIKYKKQTVWQKYQNRFITNYETIQYAESSNYAEIKAKDPEAPETIVIVELPELEDRPFEPITPLQLLMFNTQESYPFSDRLIEYLTGNVITEWDENPDNIRRAQKVLTLNSNKIAFDGAWDGTMRRIFYDYMMNGKPSGDQFTFDINHDTLGYVDKDVEKFYTAWKLEYCLDKNGNRIQVTEKVKDVNGNYIIDPLTGKPKEVPLYRLVNALLTEEQKKLLLENREFILTAQDLGTMPLYKQRFVPQGTIGSINIYEEEE